jgi:hypothetical protein
VYRLSDEGRHEPAAVVWCHAVLIGLLAAWPQASDVAIRHDPKKRRDLRFRLMAQEALAPMLAKHGPT